MLGRIGGDLLQSGSRLRAVFEKDGAYFKDVARAQGAARGVGQLVRLPRQPARVAGAPG